MEVNDLIYLMPNKPWNWHSISSNIDINLLNYMLKKGHKFNWFDVSKSAKITYNDIINNDYCWNPAGVAMNPNITWDIIKSNPRGFNNKNWLWDMNYVSQNASITWEILCANPHESWNWKHLTSIISPTMSILSSTLISSPFSSHNGLPASDRWDWKKLSSQYNIDVDDIFNNNTLPWSFDGLCSNPSLGWEHVIFHYNNKPQSLKSHVIEMFCKSNKFNIRQISAHKNINWKTVCDNPNGPLNATGWSWDHIGLSCNPNIDIRIISAFPNGPPEAINWKGWSKMAFSCNQNVNFDLIKSSPITDWDWTGVSLNANITPQTVADNPHFPWDWNALSYNPAILGSKKVSPLDLIERFEESSTDYQFHQSSIRKTDHQSSIRKIDQEFTNKCIELGDKLSNSTIIERLLNKIEMRYIKHG